MRKNISEEDPTTWVDVQEKIFPRSRKVCLNEKILNKLWMTQEIIRERDLLLFNQLMFPLCDTPLSRIQEDKRIQYYSKIEKCSNLYAYQIGLGGSYGHGFKPVKIPDYFDAMDSL